MNIQGKVAIVTGAGGTGSGRAIARRLAREGAKIVVADIDERGGGETVSLIESEHGSARFVRTDVRIESEVSALVGSAVQHYGGLDVLVNDASSKVFPEKSLDDWFVNVGVDLLGAMYAVRHAIEAMRKLRGGAIVNISSTSALAHGGRSKAPGYDTAKAGILRLTTCLASLAAENIRVNCLVPDWIASDDVRAYWEALTFEQRREDDAPERLTTLEEIADAVLRLVTDDSLAGRVMVWWSDGEPRLIPFGDAGYVRLE